MTVAMFDIVLIVSLSVLGALLLLSVLFLLAVRGRTGFADWKVLGSKPFAHRGLHDKEKPENSLSAFKAAKEKGYGVEFDVHLLKDGTLAVFHDSSLKRMTGKEGMIEDLESYRLREFHLNKTDETIPTFDEVLSVFDGKEPLVIELKHHGRNAAELCRAVCDRLDSYDGVYCIESFDPRCVLWLKKNRPEIVRGFLAQSPRSYENLAGILKFLLGNLLLNFLIKPDFVAYKFDDRNNIFLKTCQKLWKVKGVLWTLVDESQYKAAEKEGCMQIFEGFEPDTMR